MNKIPTGSFVVALLTQVKLSKLYTKLTIHSLIHLLFTKHIKKCVIEVCIIQMFVQRNRSNRMKRVTVMFYQNRWGIFLCKSVAASQ